MARSIVLTHEDAEDLDYFGQMLLSRFRMTDTWHRTPQGWRLLGSQVLAVHQDPPAAALDAATLCGYAGRYVLTPDISVTARCDGDHLVFVRAGRTLEGVLEAYQVTWGEILLVP